MNECKLGILNLMRLFQPNVIDNIEIMFPANLPMYIIYFDSVEIDIVKQYRQIKLSLPKIEPNFEKSVKGI